MKNRVDALNRLIKENGYKSYLEIGFQYGISFNGVECEHKVAVDPNPLSDGCTHQMTSDEFFAANKEMNNVWEQLYDIIFIDGDHSYPQCFLDAVNAMETLNKGGCIVFHDSNPSTPQHATPTAHGGAWCGEVYKAIIELRKKPYHIETYPFDFGVTVLRPDLEMKPLPSTFANDYDTFDKNRNLILNYIQ